MRYEPGVLSLIDQRRLPADEYWLRCESLEDVAVAIETMVVRGAPAIGCSAAYAVAVDARRFHERHPRKAWSGYRDDFARALARLARTRPTAVNLFYALRRMETLGAGFLPETPLTEVEKLIEAEAKHQFDDDLATCMAIGRHGAALAHGKRQRILTHCNAGSLATAGYGTALGVVRALHVEGLVDIVYADETRPYLQGSRLTAYELASEGIPYKVIVDSAAAYLMQHGKVDMVVVGADRIAANGDTANKIGTYGLAVQCKHHGIPFYVAAPLSTFDRQIPDGSHIPVEERSPDEIRLSGSRQMTPKDAGVWNPSFDVTPAALIAGIVTEKGVLRAPFGDAIAALR
jgi:methylthioribose-1-phosphate isomerase